MDQSLHYIVELDEYLAQAVQALGPWAYGAIFLTIFAETGLVVMPFLPGESLLLTSGTLAGADVLNIAVLWPLLFLAAFLGDVVNYLIGRWLGRHLLSKPRRFLKPDKPMLPRDSGLVLSRGHSDRLQDYALGDGTISRRSRAPSSCWRRSSLMRPSSGRPPQPVPRKKK